MKSLLRIVNDESAQGLVEYAFLISLVLLAAVGSVIIFGDSVYNLYKSIKNEIINVL